MIKMGELARLLVNGTEFSRGDYVMLLTNEDNPMVWHYISGKPLRVSRNEIIHPAIYESRVEEQENLVKEYDKQGEQ